MGNHIKLSKLQISNANSYNRSAKKMASKQIQKTLCWFENCNSSYWKFKKVFNLKSQITVQTKRINLRHQTDQNLLREKRKYLVVVEEVAGSHPIQYRLHPPLEKRRMNRLKMNKIKI